MSAPIAPRKPVSASTRKLMAANAREYQKTVTAKRLAREAKYSATKSDGCKLCEIPVGCASGAHHWLIASPDGAWSSGRCKNCGWEKDFRNYSEGDFSTSFERELMV